MEKLILKILIVIILVSCKEEPSYNPFDEQFNVAVTSLAAANCDTVSAGCGFFNLENKVGKLKVYYQVFMDDWQKVVAKGFFYTIDTLRGTNLDYFQLDSIKKMAFDAEEIDQELERFGYKISYINGDSIQVINPSIKDTVDLGVSYSFVDSKTDLIVRSINYYKEPL